MENLKKKHGMFQNADMTPPQIGEEQTQVYPLILYHGP